MYFNALNNFSSMYFVDWKPLKVGNRPGYRSVNLTNSHQCRGAEGKATKFRRICVCLDILPTKNPRFHLYIPQTFLRGKSKVKRQENQVNLSSKGSSRRPKIFTYK